MGLISPGWSLTEHTGALGNPSFAWIIKKNGFFIFFHRHPAPSGVEHCLSYYSHPLLIDLEKKLEELVGKIDRSSDKATETDSESQLVNQMPSYRVPQKKGGFVLWSVFPSN